MAAPGTPDIQSILNALKGAQQPAPPGPYSHAPPGNSYPPQAASYGAQPPAAYAPPPYGQPPAQAGGYPSYPAPSATGSIDLSNIRPSNSGTLTLEQAISHARNYATEQGITPHDRSQDRGYRRSRSRSPPGRRDGYRDNFNPYRDERRNQRDRSYSPGPRGRNFSPRGGHGRERSPMRGRDDNIEMMEIDSSLVGLIIGRQGENLRRIEGETQCRVQFIPATGPNEPFRQCKITGPPVRRAEARDAINQIIQDSGLGPSSGRGAMGGGRGGGGGSGFTATSSLPPVPKEGEATLKIMVPDRTVGLIIGRGGETIRDLQERSHCHINIVSENKSVNGLRPVNLIGTPEAAKIAKDAIMEIVESDSRNAAGGGGGGSVGGGGGRPPRGGDLSRDFPGAAGGGDRVNDSIFVPAEAVGMIIGKGGETIREMQNLTGCKINVSQTGEVEREIGLVGSLDAISLAKQAIQEKVDAVQQKSGAGGGGRGRRDFDNSNYGQTSNNYSSSAPQTAAVPAVDGAADPYAAYGGYQAYLAMWYMAAQQNQQAAGQDKSPGDAAPPPGTR